jgi:acyl-CoA thioester hydrolase
MTATVFNWTLRVYYEDTDASGVVYHANYLRWFERARTEWLRTLGYEQHSLAQRLGAVFTVAGMEISFRRPARLDDQLQVELRVASVRAASLQFEQVLRRAGDGELLASVRVKVGCVDAATFRPAPVPPELRAAMAGWAAAR